MTPPDMDPEVVALVNAINQLPGICTTSSCCGHGERPIWIFFRPETMEALPALLYYLSPCHSGLYGWRCVVTTDCGMSPASFCVESTSMGKTAYREAAIIANLLQEHVRGSK